MQPEMQMPTPVDQQETLKQAPNAPTQAAESWPGNTYSLSYEQQEQRAATALKVLAPLGFEDGNDEGESPGVIYLSSGKGGGVPGIMCYGFSFDVSRHKSLGDALDALWPALAEHFREQGREEIRAAHRSLMGCAMQPAKPSRALLDQQAEQAERDERYLEDRIRRIAREEARRV